jgi:endoribonuclease Dicer
MLHRLLETMMQQDPMLGVRLQGGMQRKQRGRAKRFEDEDDDSDFEDGVTAFLATVKRIDAERREGEGDGAEGEGAANGGGSADGGDGKEGQWTAEEWAEWEKQQAGGGGGGGEKQQAGDGGEVSALQKGRLNTLREKWQSRRQEQIDTSRAEWLARAASTARHLLREVGPWSAHGFLDRLVRAQADNQQKIRQLRERKRADAEEEADATSADLGLGFFGPQPRPADSTNAPPAAAAAPEPVVLEPVVPEPDEEITPVMSATVAEEAAAVAAAAGKPALTEINDSSVVSGDRPPPAQPELTPKVRALLEVLAVQSRRPGFSGIIFVHRRQTAIWLAEVIRRCKRLPAAGGQVVPAALVGHGTVGIADTLASDTMQLKEQHAVLAKFRAGGINLLVATSLVEEGLDVRACTLVVRFNEFYTLASYVQSRGRARHPCSLYVLMVEASSKQKRLLAASSEAEKMVRAAANEDRAVMRTRGEEGEVSEEFVGADRVYRVDRTGAVATVNSCVALISHYCAHLPRDKFCYMAPLYRYQKVGGAAGNEPAVPPEATGVSIRTQNRKTGDAHGLELAPGQTVVCTLELPLNSAVHTVVSEPQRSADKAKQMVCLEACRRLHKCGALNDHLLPSRGKAALQGGGDGGGEAEQGPDPTGRLGRSYARRRQYTLRAPVVLAAPPECLPARSVAEQPKVRCWGYRFWLGHAFADQRAFCLLTHAALPPVAAFELAVKSLDGAVINAGAWPLGTFTLTTKQLSAARRFNAALFASGLTKTKPQHFVYQPGERGTSTYVLLPLVEPLLVPPPEVTGPGELGPEVCAAWEVASAKPAADGWASFDRPTMDKVISMSEPAHWEPVALDSQLLGQAAGGEPGSESGGWLADQVVVTRYNMQKYLVRRVRHDLSPESPFPNDMVAKEDELVLDEPIRLGAIKTIRPDSGFKQPAATAATDADAADAAPARPKKRWYATYAEYYRENWKCEVAPCQPLLEVEFTGVRHMMTNVGGAPKKGRDVLLLVPELCLRYPLPYTALFLPPLCIRVERLLMQAELREAIGWPTVERPLFAQALHAPFANPDWNYERLENLGDALLKYTVSVHLFLKFPQLHEGQLSTMRMQMISNAWLHKCAIAQGMQHYLVGGPPLPKAWAAPGAWPRPQSIADKTLADVMEALIGAFFLAGGGLAAALHFMRWAGIMVCDPGPVLQPQLVWAAEGEPRRRRLAEANALADPLEQFERRRLGYVFTHKPLLVEAVTHASYRAAATPCYQRLEYLGDAVLDYIVTVDLYNDYPGIGPGKMSDLRNAGVNNEMLAAIAVAHGYHHCLYHHSAELLGEMTSFVQWVADGGHVGAAAADEDRPADAPKVLGDLFESVAAAVLLDGGPDAARLVIRRLMLAHMQRFATPETVVVDPRRALQEACVRRGIFDYTEYRVLFDETPGRRRRPLGIAVFLDKGRTVICCH